MSKATELLDIMEDAEKNKRVNDLLKKHSDIYDKWKKTKKGTPEKKELEQQMHDLHLKINNIKP